MTGGKSEVHGGGIYMKPTIVVGVTHYMELMTEETFAPIIPVMPFDTIEEAIYLANDSKFGLSGAVIAGNKEKAREIGMQINAGGITLQDTTLTNAIIRDAEKNYFGLSGMGESRMGPNAIVRYLRRKVLISNTETPMPMSAWLKPKWGDR